MARVNLPPTVPTRAGVAPAAEVNGDTANGHFFANDGNTLLLVRNAGGAAFNVTINLSQTVDGLSVSPRVVSVPAGESRYIGPFPVAAYGSVVNVDVDGGSGTNLKLSTYKVA